MSRGVRFSPFPDRRSIRAPKAQTTFCVRARRFARGPEDVIDALASGAHKPAGTLFDDSDLVLDDEPLFDELELFPEQGGFAFEEAAPRRQESAVWEAAPSPPAGPRADAREVVVSLLGPAPVAVDELIRIAGLPARDVHGVLTELDLAGRLERHGANAVSLIFNQE
jgi:DNA processing protein